jgi:dolichol-phosphate mannosyltransferase
MPVRAASLMGILLSTVGLMYAVVLIFARLVYGFNAQGWTSLMVVLLLVSGAQMLMLGVLGEYVWRNLDETRKRPRFIVETITKGDTDNTPAPPPAGAPDTDS